MSLIQLYVSQNSEYARLNEAQLGLIVKVK